MIPRRLVRTIPASPGDQAEMFWRQACELHPGWEHITYREPIDPAAFPLTGHLWGDCQNGAQKAGLIRLEALISHGGVYIDSDVQVFRPFDNLRGLAGFAAWEDDDVVPDAVLAAEPRHPALLACLDLAISRLGSASTNWRDGNGAWSTGPGVTTTILPGRDDFALLPPGCFYPVHYSRRCDLPGHRPEPWTYAMHWWAASWLPPELRR